MKSAERWAASASVTALGATLAVTVDGSPDSRVLLTALALTTAVATWRTLVYSFPLRYLRLHAAWEDFDFPIAEHLNFSDFVTISLTVSAAGAFTAVTPRMRPGLNMVRTHSVLTFVFNAAILVLLVSLTASLGTS
jgi:uncharacterized membrane protein